MDIESERRHLTVLFCDLVDSTRFILDEEYDDFAEDPDASGAVEAIFTAACTRVITACGGRVSQLLGDGVLAVFGHPAASEDDAANAVRAGHELAQLVPTLELPAPFADDRMEVRVGIATGLVLTAPAGPDGHVPIRGRTTVLAQRLQSIAAPGEVLLSTRTRDLAQRRFTFKDCGSRLLKGFARPVVVWRAVAPRSTALRFPRDRAERPLVGRAADLERLNGWWEQARAGRGRGVLVSGDAGIGKSRLIQELLKGLGDPQVPILSFQCERLYAGTALHPVIEHVRRAAGISFAEPVRARFDRLAAWYDAPAPDADAIAVLGNLLAIGTDERYPLPELSTQRLKQRWRDVLLDYLRRQALARGAVVLFEDLHWVDPTTEELLELTSAGLPDARVFLLCTARPDYAPDWLRQAGIEQLRLQALGRDESLSLIRSLGARDLDDGAVSRIADLTDGVPIFIEELTEAVRQSGRLDVLRGAPPTLADLLGARLDQVGTARRLAGIASVVGREFAQDLLERLHEGTEEEYRAGVQALVDERLIVPVSGSEAEGVRLARSGDLYAFRHALVQGVAYDRLPQRERLRLHRRVAETLLQHFPQKVEDEPEVLAHHWTEAGDCPEAVTWWLRAGRHASQRGDYREARRHLERGLQLSEGLGDASLRLERELALRLALGPVLITTQGAGTPEVVALYRRSLELCAVTPPSPLHFIAHWGWWRITMDHRTGQERADRLIVLARDLKQPDLEVQAHHCQWATLYMMGRHEQCLSHAEAGLALYEPSRDSVHSGLYGGHDAKVCALGESALSLWMTGAYARADERADASIAWSRELAHVGSRVHAMDYALVLQKFRRSYEAVEAQGAELAAYGREQRLKVFHAKGNVFRGWARALQGGVSEGLARMLEGMESERAADTPHDFTLYLEMLAEVLGLAGRHAEALRRVDEAFEVAGNHGIVYWNPELHRRRGELLRALGQDDAADAQFREALRVAALQGARSLELRAGLSLAQLHASRGSRVIVDALRSAYDLLIGDVETEDLREARLFLGPGP